MKAKKMDIDQLKIIGAHSKHNPAEIKQVIDLFKSRKIERFDTARNIIEGLSSRGAIKQQKAKEKLNFYDEIYVPRSDPKSKTLPLGSNSFIKPKPESNPEKLAILIIGDMNKAKTFIDLRFISTSRSPFINGHGNDMRSFQELINPHRSRVYNALKDAIKVKKSMKIRLRFHFKAIQYELDEDNNDKSIILDVTNISNTPLEVNRHSYVSNLDKLYKELDERSQEYAIQPDFKPEDLKQNAGSNWTIHKYMSLAVDIFAVNSVRGSSYIPTPENIAMLSVVLLVLGMKMLSVLDGVCYITNLIRALKILDQLHYKR